MQLLKGESAHWTNKTGLLKGRLAWADKYFAASVSEGKIEIVKAYIRNRQSHHQKQNFATEYKRF